MNEIKDFPSFTISLLEEGIVLIEYKGIEMRLNDMIQLYDEIEKSGRGNRVAVLNIFKEYVPLNEEAMKYSASDRPPELIYASAIVVDSLATRLITMMFMNFNKQKVLRKVFNSKKKALDWLRKIRNEEKFRSELSSV